MIAPNNAQADGIDLPTLPSVKLPNSSQAIEQGEATMRIAGSDKDWVVPVEVLITQNDKEKRQLSYQKDTENYRTQIESPEWQIAYADKRSFAVFGRNYINRIHCNSVISDVIYPTTKGVELELKNNGHDLFLRISNDVPPSFTHFPIDLNVICNGAVFQINGVVDVKYPATNVELKLNTEHAQEDLSKFSNIIKKSTALPHEEQISKIMLRVYQENYLTFWKVQKQNNKINTGNTHLLRKIVRTNINGITAFDFMLDDVNMNFQQLSKTLEQHLKGEIIAIGRVILNNAQRVIILTTGDKI